MFIIIGIMLTGMLFGFLLRNKRLSWIHKIITLLIWVLLFLLGIDVGGNEAIIKGLHTLGLEALIITLAAVTGSILEGLRAFLDQSRVHNTLLQHYTHDFVQSFGLHDRYHRVLHLV